jgi:hypothetical protein
MKADKWLAVRPVVKPTNLAGDRAGCISSIGYAGREAPAYWEYPEQITYVSCLNAEGELATDETPMKHGSVFMVVHFLVVHLTQARRVATL